MRVELFASEMPYGDLADVMLASLDAAYDKWFLRGYERIQDASVLPQSACMAHGAGFGETFDL
ncbi:MAG: hypothetical protein LC737_01785 [Chloroflexi bacterium]|nr:hypothetical protein [Chloroflexota bacterium]